MIMIGFYFLLEEYMIVYKICVVCLDNDVIIECFRYEMLGWGWWKMCDVWCFLLIFCELD